MTNGWSSVWTELQKSLKHLGEKVAGYDEVSIVGGGCCEEKEEFSDDNDGSYCGLEWDDYYYNGRHCSKCIFIYLNVL